MHFLRSVSNLIGVTDHPEVLPAEIETDGGKIIREQIEEILSEES